MGENVPEDARMEVKAHLWEAVKGNPWKYAISVIAVAAMVPMMESCNAHLAMNHPRLAQVLNLGPFWLGVFLIFSLVCGVGALLWEKFNA